jgi:hypothetical protein
MTKPRRTLLRVMVLALVACAACTSDQGQPTKGDGEPTSQEPKKKQRLAFAETSKASLTHKGRTLAFESAVGIVRADSKLVEVFFFPYALTDAQKAGHLDGDMPTFVNDEAPGHDPANWPHKPLCVVKVYFKDDSQTCTTDDIARCSLSIQGWENATSTAGVPLESTVESLTLSALKAGERVRLKGAAKGRYGDETSITFDADTILIAPAF